MMVTTKTGRKKTQQHANKPTLIACVNITWAWLLGQKVEGGCWSTDIQDTGQEEMTSISVLAMQTLPF